MKISKNRGNSQPSSACAPDTNNASPPCFTRSSPCLPWNRFKINSVPIQIQKTKSKRSTYRSKATSLSSRERGERYSPTYTQRPPQYTMRTLNQHSLQHATKLPLTASHSPAQRSCHIRFIILSSLELPRTVRAGSEMAETKKMHPLFRPRFTHADSRLYSKLRQPSCPSSAQP